MEPRSRAEPVAAPSSEQGPAQVLEAVLAALARPGRDPEPAAERAVDVVYAFASPRMRAAVGGSADFRRAFRTTLYAPLLGHEGARVASLETRGDAARAVVEVTTREGTPATFTCALARLHAGPRAGYWLLSGIAREGVDL